MAISRARLPHKRVLPPLENGDRLNQATFHARYEAMPAHVRAELIGGIVYMSSPMKRWHGRYGALFTRWLDEYEEATPGTEVLVGATSILGPESDPEPDGCLIILPEYGGQTWEDENGYLNGAPEFVGEISYATESIDLHAKKLDYEKAAVREYLVLALRQHKAFWFARRKGKFRELAPGKDGIFRSEVFPGLWLDQAAFFHRQRGQLLAVLRQGLTTPLHEAFVRQLASSKS
jgi:Putative restriction endonuclease